MKSFVRDCYIQSRGGDAPLFKVKGDVVTCSLQGYAIIPIEEYLHLLPEEEEARFLRRVKPVKIR